MGAEDLEKAARQPADEGTQSGHSDAADPAGDLREELRGASGATGDDEPEALKANMKAGTKSGKDAVEGQKANLK